MQFGAVPVCTGSVAPRAILGDSARRRAALGSVNTLPLDPCEDRPDHEEGLVTAPPSDQDTSTSPAGSSTPAPGGPQSPAALRMFLLLVLVLC